MEDLFGTHKRTQKQKEIQEANIAEILEDKYVSYALSTILDRAMPDVRDGLKTVQRRILFAMKKLNIGSNTAPKKCARIVGDVIGKFHPHGNDPVYMALVRMAQDFSFRYPLIEGQGNFGTIDGDNPAAMRYTEAKLTIIAELMLQDIDQDTVDFKETYDGTDSEPVLLPNKFPNLLANGTTGIAVGMATSIPSHNLQELIDCATILLKNPNADNEVLFEKFRGPDFATGGIIIDNEDVIKKIYSTGKGSIRVRSRYHVENTSRGQWQVVVTEIPYQVYKDRIVEKISKLLSDKKLSLVGEVIDESAEDIRLIINPRSKLVDVELMMLSLFKATDLESRFSVNMNAVFDGTVPRLFSLKSGLKEWIDHLRIILVRKSNFRLDKIVARLHIIDGLLVAYLNLDEVIKIIRESDIPKLRLIEKFKITETQAESILNLRLRVLRKIDEIELSSEKKDLLQEEQKLSELVKNDDKQTKQLLTDLKQLRAFAEKSKLSQRRTSFELEKYVDVGALKQASIEKEKIIVAVTKNGWIKGFRGEIVGKFVRDDDELFLSLEIDTTEQMLFVCDSGVSYTLDVARIPLGRANKEMHLNALLDLPKDYSIVSAFRYRADQQVLLASSKGYGFRMNSQELLSSTRKGKNIFIAKAPDEVLICVALIFGDAVLLLNSDDRAISFPVSSVPLLKKGRGVVLQKLKAEQSIKSCVVYDYSRGVLVETVGKDRLGQYDLSKWGWQSRGGVGKDLPFKLRKKQKLISSFEENKRRED